MKIEPIGLSGCLLIEPKVFEDERGYFFESYRQDLLEEYLGYCIDFVQENQSLSKKGVLRGIHFQAGIHAQSKLVRVIKGAVLDVVVDLREGSPTFLNHFSIELSSKNQKQLFIPRGFGHAFLTLEDATIFSYKCDNYYDKDSEYGIRYDDVQIGINWSELFQDFIVSDKDKLLPTFDQLQGKYKW